MRRSVLLIIALFALFDRCAQVQPPSGGPKDREAPEVVRAVPANGAVNFEGDGFILKFDEYIKSSGIQRELIVTPPLEEPPKTLVKGKELHVEWDEELDPGRTYSFRFGNSIKDITEGNPAEDLVYAFSTGPRLDSLHFQGRVVDARTMEGVEGVLAMLYRDEADSVPKTQRPYYFSRTDERGHFDIPYLADASYKFFALKDKNRNQRYDLPDERIGFVQDPVRPYPADSSGELLVRLFEEARDDQYLADREVAPGRLFLRFGKPVDRLRIFPVGRKKMPWTFVERHRKGSDTARFWFSDPEMPDSIDLGIEADGLILDTIMARNASELSDGLDLEMAFEDPLERNQQAAFEAAHPLGSLDPDSILGVSDSDTVALDPFIGGPVSRKLVLRERKSFLKEGLKLTVLPGAVRDTFGRSIRDTMRFSFQVRKADHYGKLSLYLGSKGEDEEVILNLLNEKGEVLRRRVDRTGRWFRFPYLSPASIRIELIRDLIPNGKWDPGSYPDRQPEPVLYYPDTMKVRSNWEQEIEWRGIGE